MAHALTNLSCPFDIAKRLKGDSDSEDNATAICATYTSPKTRRNLLASIKKSRKQPVSKQEGNHWYLSRKLKGSNHGCFLRAFLIDS